MNQMCDASRTALGLTTFLLLTGAVTAWAAEPESLEDVLLRKGVLTQQEADQVQQKEKTEASDIGLPEALKGLDVESLAYLDYSAGKMPAAGNTQTGYNRFSLTRGYITIKKQQTDWLAARATTDIHQETSGANIGDWKVRMKYLYAELKPGDLGFLSDNKVELGLGHMPWLDFAEHVNPYRAQGTMPIERAGIFNSADVGVSARGYFGGTLAHAKDLTDNAHYAGRWGSWHIGLYNGGGYHAPENNQNKVLEGRFSARPLPEVLPGLQFTYLGMTGRGNTAAKPDYDVHLGMASYEHPDFIVTAQYFTTKGNQNGTLIDGTGRSLKTDGYSFFGNLKLPVCNRKLAAFARYDHFDADKDSVIGSAADYDMYIAGLAYTVHKGNMVVLSFEQTDYGKDSAGKGKVPVVNNRLGDDYKFQLVYQINY